MWLLYLVFLSDKAQPVMSDKRQPCKWHGIYVKNDYHKNLTHGSEDKKDDYFPPHVDPHHLVKVFQWSGFNTSFENYTSIVDLFIGGNIYHYKLLIMEITN